VSRLFDKDHISARPATVPRPYSSKNLRAKVSITVVSLSFTRSVTDTLALLTTQNLYPDHQINVEILDGDDNGQLKASSNDTGDSGAALVEQIAPSPIGSSALEQVHSSTVD
jgi:hypothetical protein